MQIFHFIRGTSSGDQKRVSAN